MPLKFKTTKKRKNNNKMNLKNEFWNLEIENLNYVKNIDLNKN